MLRAESVRQYFHFMTAGQPARIVLVGRPTIPPHWLPPCVIIVALGRYIMPRLFSCLLLFLLALPLRAQMPSSAQPPTQDRLVQLLKELTEAPGPPGYEEAVRKLFTDHMKPFADSVSYDGLGSVIAQQGNSGPRIMLDAHMDELGGMIRRIRPDGLISMQMLG